MTYENGERMYVLDEVEATIENTVTVRGRIAEFDRINGKDFVVIGTHTTEGEYKKVWASANSVRKV